MHILVTGGAGYIGSITVSRLLEKGYSVTIFDKEKEVHGILASKKQFVQGNLLDVVVLDKLFQDNTFDAVIHFAAYLSVGESMEKPGLYFQNNVSGTLNLLSGMIQYGVRNIIFSSTGSVYGNATSVQIPETATCQPTNPYAESKYMAEKMLFWHEKATGMHPVVLRYFNVAGAALDGSTGENHTPEPHIIPRVLIAGLRGERFELFGTDYLTKDGTCIRDYIHVVDLADAHILALSAVLEKRKLKNVYNVGTGQGYSNLDIIHAIERNTGMKIHILPKKRRPGDPKELVADPREIRKDLGFVPKYSDLDTIITTAWKWQKNLHTQ